MLEQTRQIGEASRKWLHLHLYVYRNDPSHRGKINAAAIGLALGLISAIGVGWTTVPAFVSSAATIGGIVLAALGFLALIWRGAHLYPPPKDHIFASVRRADLMVEDGSVEIPSQRLKFRQLPPSREAKSDGFQCPTISSACDETALASEDFDNRLYGLSAVPCARIDAPQEQFLSKDPIQRSDQLLFVATTVGARRSASNDDKVLLASPLSRFAQGVTLKRIRYFDSLATVEAYRHQIERRTELTGEFDAIEADLTKYFPLYKEPTGSDGPNYFLPDLPIPRIANHVAITTLALARHEPILVQQTNRNVVGAGTIAACGSGSMDWSDMDNCGSTNFLSAVRYAMARELCEEGNLTASSKHSGEHRKALCQPVAERTKVIGFFRWVDRCGNPEFLGVTRLDDAETVEADRREVWKLTRRPKMRIERLSDFNALLQSLERNQN